MDLRKEDEDKLRAVLKGCVCNYRVNGIHVNSSRYLRQILAHRNGKGYAAICGYFLA